jgi:hypothetical protein
VKIENFIAPPKTPNANCVVVDENSTGGARQVSSRSITDRRTRSARFRDRTWSIDLWLGNLES